VTQDISAAFPHEKGISPETMITIPCTPEGAPARLVTIFGSLAPNHEKHVRYIFDLGGPDYSEIVLTADRPLASIARQVPAAAWYERELHDQYGIEITGHPDLRSLILHENWPDGVYPMVDPVDNVPWSKRDYRFLQVQGEGVAEVAVGPVHAGIIEPGHFRFTATGETVVRLEQRLGYVHKGIESLMTGASIERAAKLAARTSGDSTVAYGIAFAHAVEAALRIEPPPRARYLRALMAELERLANHLGDIGAICNDASFSIMHAHCGILREHVLRASAASFSHRLMMDRVVPGGVARDLDGEGITGVRALVADLRRHHTGRPDRPAGCRSRPCGRAATSWCRRAGPAPGSAGGGRRPARARR